MLKIAAQLNDPANNFYGIAFNGQRGQALGQQMAHFYAAFGQHPFDDKMHPTLDTPDAVRAAKYSMELKKYAPPDLLNMAWDERARQFSQGGAAMVYEWAARSFMAEAARQVQGVRQGRLHRRSARPGQAGRHPQR